jgi:hypothetical protein
MTDINEPAEAQPVIRITDSPLATITEQAIVIARLAVIVVGGAVSLLAFVKTKDILGAMAFLKTEQGVAAVAAAGTIATTVVGLWRTYVKRRRSIVGLDAAPNSVAVVNRPSS